MQAASLQTRKCKTHLERNTIVLLDSNIVGGAVKVKGGSLECVNNGEYRFIKRRKR